MERFYKIVTTEYSDENKGYVFFLDNKIIKTPQKNILSTQSYKKANIVKQEWEAQTQKINPDMMPYTKFLNNVNDKILIDRKSVIQFLMNFVDNDTLFYFTPQTEVTLYKWQQENWLPIIHFFNENYQLSLNYGTDICLEPQKKSLHQFIENFLIHLTAEEFSAFYKIISVLGSHLLAIYAYKKHISFKDAFDLAHLEIVYNTQKWGEDLEDKKRKKNILDDYFTAVAFLTDS